MKEISNLEIKLLKRNIETNYLKINDLITFLEKLAKSFKSKQKIVNFEMNVEFKRFNSKVNSSFDFFNKFCLSEIKNSQKEIQKFAIKSFKEEDSKIYIKNFKQQIKDLETTFSAETNKYNISLINRISEMLEIYLGTFEKEIHIKTKVSQVINDYRLGILKFKKIFTQSIKDIEGVLNHKKIFIKDISKIENAINSTSHMIREFTASFEAEVSKVVHDILINVNKYISLVKTTNDKKTDLLKFLVKETTSYKSLFKTYFYQISKDFISKLDFKDQKSKDEAKIFFANLEERIISTVEEGREYLNDKISKVYIKILSISDSYYDNANFIKQFLLSFERDFKLKAKIIQDIIKLWTDKSLNTFLSIYEYKRSIYDFNYKLRE